MLLVYDDTTFGPGGFVILEYNDTGTRLNDVRRELLLKVDLIASRIRDK